MGVTAALAFELPDKPLYHITSELRENLQKRLHPELYTTTSAPSNNTNSAEHIFDDIHSRIDYNNNDLKYVKNKQSYYNTMNKHNYYYEKLNGLSDKLDKGNKTVLSDDNMMKKVVKT